MDLLHSLTHGVLGFIGGQVGANPPVWIHWVLHLILLWAPFTLFAALLWIGVTYLRRRRSRPPAPEPLAAEASPLSVFAFVLRYSRKDQLGLVALGLVSMPVLYATLELPKSIINSALADSYEEVELFGYSLSQVGILILLCAGYLFAIGANGALKFLLNVYKGKVGERLLRRLRLTIYRAWRRGAGGPGRTEVIPLLAQEVEPIGGFASDAFALPVFQGGTVVTILVFMFAQDPVLGAAAMTLLPVQLILIPRLQRRINEIMRRRVRLMRSLGGRLGEQANAATDRGGRIEDVTTLLRQLEAVRREMHRAKFFMKGVNNFLTALTPFFFYSIGGYLVIEGSLTIGALVAVLAAYKDFSAPVKELFRYYQSVEDVRIRFSEALVFTGGDPALAARMRRSGGAPS